MAMRVFVAMVLSAALLTGGTGCGWFKRDRPKVEPVTVSEIDEGGTASRVVEASPRAVQEAARKAFDELGYRGPAPEGSSNELDSTVFAANSEGKTVSVKAVRVSARSTRVVVSAPGSDFVRTRILDLVQTHLRSGSTSSSGGGSGRSAESSRSNVIYEPVGSVAATARPVTITTGAGIDAYVGQPVTLRGVVEGDSARLTLNGVEIGQLVDAGAVGRRVEATGVLQRYVVRPTPQETRAPTDQPPGTYYRLVSAGNTEAVARVLE